MATEFKTDLMKKTERHQMELKIKDNPYWEKITRIAEKQRKKGLATYGMGIEDNPMSLLKRLDYLTEELIDALMYIQWIREAISGKDDEDE